MDVETLPCKIYIYVKGEVNIAKDVGQGLGIFKLTNNGLAFLFFEMRYKMNGTEI